MAISVRQRTKPTLIITGRQVNLAGGHATKALNQYDGDPVAYTIDHSVSLSNSVATDINVRRGGFAFNTTNIPVFRGNISFTLTLPSQDYELNIYNTTTGKFFGRVGKTADNNFNEKADFVYTLNGKPPTRTKNYLYRPGAPVTIRRNTVGDRTVIRARIFYAGDASPEAIAIIRIINVKEINKLLGV